MLDKIIDEISKNFINEALSSPNLLSDMAAMEKYMSESYNGRIFIELLQNADDCYSNKIFLTNYDNAIIFANNGKPFDESDILSISRSGASNKERGKNIGYRGVGFKSTAYLTDEIIIYSDNTYFTFSQKACAKKLNMNIKDIPLIRIPLLLQCPDDKLHNKVLELVNKGYTSIFIFKNAKTDIFIEELLNVTESDFIFLNNIERCIIQFHNVNFCTEIYRNKKIDQQLITFKNGCSWLIIQQDNASVGFNYDIKNHKIIPCSENEQVYHSYLPTFDKLYFPAKVNADFSTDPSRKHIVVDSKTQSAIKCISEILANIVTSILNGKASNEYSNIFTILNSFNNFSKLNNILKQELQQEIIKNVRLQTSCGTTIQINEYKLLPEWLEESEKFFIRTNSKLLTNISCDINVYKIFYDVDNFIKQYSNCQFTEEDVINLMQEKELVKHMSPETQGKILGKIIKSAFLSEKISFQKTDLSDIKILTNIGIKSIAEISLENIKIDSTIQKSLNDSTMSSDLNWFTDKYKIKIDYNKSTRYTHLIANDNQSLQKEIVIKPHISKWRSAEQQCIEIEKFFGNNATDVSKRNIGYDIESITPMGNIRRIEVKSIIDKGGFSITNNEYTAAHQYGDEYYLCLIFQNDNNIKLTYIQNPLQTIKFEKRIRQWEWFCEEYGGESYTFDL